MCTKWARCRAHWVLVAPSYTSNLTVYMNECNLEVNAHFSCVICNALPLECYTLPQINPGTHLCITVPITQLPPLDSIVNVQSQSRKFDLFVHDRSRSSSLSMPRPPAAKSSIISRTPDAWTTV
jgi:hypothetical protein